MCAAAGDEQPHVGVLESKGTYNSIDFSQNAWSERRIMRSIVKHIFVIKINCQSNYRRYKTFRSFAFCSPQRLPKNKINICRETLHTELTI